MRRSSQYVPFHLHIRVIMVAVFLAFVVILFRLWNLQITHGMMYRELSTNNRVRRVILAAPRGKIFDRNGVVLADTRPSYDLTIFLEDLEDMKGLSKRLAPIIDRTEEEVLKKLQRAVSDRGRLPYIPYTLKKDLSLKEVIQIEEINFDLPGVSIATVPIRHYPYADLTAHLIGYIGKINKKEYSEQKDKGYFRWDIIGKSGVEKTKEKYLRGAHGGKQVQINNRNLLDKILGKKDPVKGHDLYLTIDIDIQKKVGEAFDDYRGACMMMDVRTGEVLTYISRPSFDPNYFSTGDPAISRLFVDKTYPLIDRIINGEYAPGSTFKPIVALAGLREKVVDSSTSVLCTGVFRFGGIRFKCWKKYGHGEVNLDVSLEQSCNVYYYNIGKEIGWKPIFEMGKLFGFGKKTGIELTGEKKGILPSESWKRKKIGEPWYKGESINYSIGQGYLLITPAQLGVYAAALANRGILLTPVIEKKVIDNNGSVMFEASSAPGKKIDINLEDLALVRHGMYSVVHGKKGTGRRAKLKELGILMAGKTGTAQASEDGMRINHSWFISFAPYDDPVVACIVLVEHTDSGAKFASPIAHAALKAYFEKNPVPKKEEKSS